MKTLKTGAAVMLAIGLVGLVTVAQADLGALVERISGHDRYCAAQGVPWYGYVVERGRGWIMADRDGYVLKVGIDKGRMPLYVGERFRVIPLRSDGRVVTAELRHEGDVLAIVKYFARDVRGHGRPYDFGDQFRAPGHRHPTYRDNRSPRFDLDIRIDGKRRGPRGRYTPPRRYR